jgi:hypothetical protein
VYLLKLLADAHLVLLEFLDFLEDFQAFATTSVHESVSSSTPVETLDTWLDGSIEEIKVLLEQ